MKTVIHVNRQVLAQNKRDNKHKPAITAKNYKENKYGHKVDILDKDGNVVASVVHSKKPLKCGARCWIETNNSIKVTHER
jgi:hypothetical protein